MENVLGRGLAQAAVRLRGQSSPSRGYFEGVDELEDDELDDDELDDEAAGADEDDEPVDGAGVDVEAADDSEDLGAVDDFDFEAALLSVR